MKKHALITSLVMLALLATAALVSADYTDGLRAYWPFDEGNPSTTAFDAVNGHDGIHETTYTTDTPYLGGAYALSFDGNHWVKVPDDPALEGGTISVAAWVRPDCSTPSVPYILAKGNKPGYRATYALYGIGGTVRFYVSDDTTFHPSPGIAYSSLCGDWHHLVGTYDGQTVRLFVDGSEVGQGNDCVNCLTFYGLTNDHFYIGASGSGNPIAYYRGLIDEVGVWGRALSGDEILTLATGEVEIDIKPDSTDNNINLGSNGVVPVAIMSSATFDATQVDPTTVELAGSSVAVKGKGNKSLARAADVNADGLDDLMMQVETENLDPEAFQDGLATLTGRTYNGLPFQGSDMIIIVPNK